MGNFFTDVIQRDPRYRTTVVVRDPGLLEPGFREKVERFIADVGSQTGIELVAVETFRSRERQEKVFLSGASKLRTVGTHHYGLAVDFAKRGRGGKLTWDGPWDFMPRVAERYGLTSLYPGDAGHVQGCAIAQQPALFSGKWYPGAATGTGSLAPIPVSVEAPLVGDLPTDFDPAGWLRARGVDASRARAALVASDAVNERYYQRWFFRSTQAAFMYLESRFDPAAYRREPSGVASYGLWQVLDSTAAWLGHRDSAEDLYDPAVGSYYGMKYAAWGWNYLLGHLGRPPTLAEWSAGYNVGYGAIARGRSRREYSDPWLEARGAFEFLDSR